MGRFLMHFFLSCYVNQVCLFIYGPRSVPYFAEYSLCNVLVMMLVFAFFSHTIHILWVLFTVNCTPR